MSKQISILVEDDLLAEIDRWKDRCGRSRNWVIGTWLRYAQVSMMLSNRKGGLEVDLSAGAGLAEKKIAEDMSGGGGAGGGGTPGLPPMGKAQGIPSVGDLQDEVAKLRATPGFVEPDQVTPAKLRMPEWSLDWAKKIALEEPGGLMACSPDILQEMLEAAKIDSGVAAKLHLAGVALDREILVRWGLAENYKPKLESADAEVDRIEGRGAPGEIGRDRGETAEADQRPDDGAKSRTVEAGRPRVDMAALQAICDGNLSGEVEVLSSEPHEVDLCGFKSYNEGDGEWYVCAKEKHGPKIKHGEWLKV